MPEGESQKIQREFISLLLHHKELAVDWASSNLTIDRFNKEHHRLLHGIRYAVDHDVMLTRRSYKAFINTLTNNNQEIIAEEMIFVRIFSIRGKPDDYPVFKARIIDMYLLDQTIDYMRQFNTNKEKKGNSYAVHQLAESMSSLAGDAKQEQKAIFENVTDYLPTFYKNLSDVRSGKKKEEEVIPCGISEIDYAMSIGFAPGTLALFCGDIGGYKSTMMLNVAANIWKNQKKNILFVPLEMPREQMVKKLLARETEIPFDRLASPKLLNDEEVEKMRAETDRWSEMDGKFFIMEYAERTKVSIIRREIEKHMDIFKPDLVVIDYIANLIPDRERQQRNDLEIGDMLKDLRTMGRILGFSTVSGAQLGREALRRIRRQSGNNVVAYSEDLRGSHEYSADADFIFVLMPDPQQSDSLLHLLTVKSRYGKKTFSDGRTKAALEVRPEISLIRSREDMLISVDRQNILAKSEDDDLDFTEDKDKAEDKPKKKISVELEPLFEGQ